MTSELACKWVRFHTFVYGIVPAFPLDSDAYSVVKERAGSRDRHAVPHLQRIITHLETSLSDLEHAVAASGT